MRKAPLKIKEIDEYLSGELSPENVAKFEKRILEEKQMQEDVILTKNVIEGVQGSAFKKMIKKIGRELDDDSQR
jgi:hypothetical protein